MSPFLDDQTRGDELFESKLGIEIQAFLSSKLTELPLHSSQVTEARAGPQRAGVVAKPSEG